MVGFFWEPVLRGISRQAQRQPSSQYDETYMVHNLEQRKQLAELKAGHQWQRTSCSCFLGNARRFA